MDAEAPGRPRAGAAADAPRRPALRRADSAGSQSNGSVSSSATTRSRRSSTIVNLSGMAKSDVLIEKVAQRVHREGRADSRGWAGDIDADAEDGETRSLLSAEERLDRMGCSPALSRLQRLSGTLGDPRSHDARAVGVDLRTLSQVILDDAHLKRTCSFLPMTLIFFALFAFFVLEHYQTSYVYLQESNIRAELADAAAEVREVADVFRWMSAALIPKLWSSRNMPAAGPGLSSMGHNALVGGLLVRTARAAPTCAEDGAPAGFDCSAGHAAGEAARSKDPALNGWRFAPRRLAEALGLRGRGPARALGRQGRRTHLAGPEAFEPEALPRGERDAHLGGVRRPAPAGSAPQARRVGGRWARGRRRGGERHRRLKAVDAAMKDAVPSPDDSARVYSRVLPVSLGVEQASAKAAAWAGAPGGPAPLVVESTLFLTVEAILKNDDIGRGLTTQLRIHFLFSRGGNIYTQVELHTFVQRGSPSGWGAMGLWLVLLSGLTITAPLGALAAFRNGVLASHLLRVSVFLEWAIVLQGWTIVGLLATERMDNGRFLEDWDEYQEARLAADARTIGEFDESWLMLLRSSFHQLDALDVWLRIFIAYYHLVLLMRFLFAARGQPRLAILINTISQGLVDLGHLCMVFVLILAAYMMTGHIIFGNRMEEFATLRGSFGFCLQIVCQREYPWDELVLSADAVVVWLWVWSFVILVLLVIMSIFLAMVFDHYGAVRGQVSAEDTIWHTARRLIIQLKALSSWWSDHDLLLALQLLRRAQPVTAARLSQTCGGIPDEQVDMLFEAAQQKLAKTATLEKNLLSEALATILVAAHDLREGVCLLRAGGRPQAEGAASGGDETSGHAAEPAAGRDEGLPQPRAPTLLCSRPRAQPKLGGVAADRAAASAGPPPPVRRAEAGRRAPPEQPPGWLSAAVMVQLRRGRRRTEQMRAELDQVEGALRRRGLRPAPGAPAPAPGPGGRPRGGEARRRRGGAAAVSL